MKGRPTIYDNRMKRVNVALDEHTMAVARVFGEGNMSAGLRRLARLSEHMLPTELERQQEQER